MPTIANPISNRPIQMGLPKGVKPQPGPAGLPVQAPAGPVGWVGNPLAPRGMGPVTSKVPKMSAELANRLKLSAELYEFGTQADAEEKQKLEHRLRQHYESLGLPTSEVDIQVRKSLPDAAYWNAKERTLDKVSAAMLAMLNR